MTHEIIPTFTETWLEEKLAIIFDLGVQEARHNGADLMPYAHTLNVFGYNAMTVDEIEQAMYETLVSDDDLPDLFDQDADV